MSQKKAAWDYFYFEWCKKSYPEAEAVFGSSMEDNLEAFLIISGKYGYSPNPYFDEKWYIERYKDVFNEISNGRFISGFDHYRKIGFKDRNPHWAFNEEYYVSTYKDATKENINGYDHYITKGDCEFRKASLFFDPNEYTKTINNRKKNTPFLDFLLEKNSYCDGIYFNNEFYFNKYPYVKKEIENKKWKSALHHFLANSDGSLYDPNRYFSEQFYLEKYPDIKEAISSGRFQNGYEHFLLYGVKELRKPNEDVDLHKYFLNESVQSILKTHKFPDVFYLYCLFDGKIIENTKEVEKHEDISKFSFEKMCTSKSIFVSKNKIDFSYKIPDVSIIMIVHNNFEMTIGSLLSLRSSYSGDIQVIIVDSGSEDETRYINRYIGGLKLLRFEGNIGFLRGCNAALPYVEAPFVIFLNNDTEVQFGAINNSLERARKHPEVGAIGAKLIRTNGLLQEAGSIIWRDGSVVGYLRGENPDVPEANFVRRVDFCSGAFLFVRTEILRQLRGFKEDYIPAYYEETDLCVRIWEAGYEVVYDPSVIVIHYEYGTSDVFRGGEYINRNREIFISNNINYLSNKYIKSERNIHRARSIYQKNTKKILFIDDRIPLKYLGSGFSRANDIINMMSDLSYNVTVFPIYKPMEISAELYHSFPEDVEVIWNKELPDLETFFAQRTGMYDVIWISRTHNAHRLIPVIEAVAHLLSDVMVVVDTEAVSSTREIQKEELYNIPSDQRISLERRLREEFSCLSIANKIVAVNAAEAEIIRKSGFGNVSVLGHLQQGNPGEKPWNERSGLLFVGSVHDYNSPNYDSMVWFLENVWPDLEDQLPEEVKLYIVGYIRNGISLSGLPKSSRVVFTGQIDDLRDVYNNSRIFIAPTRYAAGIPFKLHEAASYGLPIVSSDILSSQLEWEDDVDIMVAETGNPHSFREKIIDLYENEDKWNKIRENSLKRIYEENNKNMYKEAIKKILE